MTTVFTYEEGSVLIRLLIAHCLTDFFFQPNNWVKEKKKKIWKSEYLWYHALITGLVAWVLLWNLHYWVAILLLSASHLLIDAMKLSINNRIERNTNHDLLLFIIDQLFHVSVIFVIWLCLIKGWPRINALSGNLLLDYRMLFRLLGYLLMAGPAGYMIQFITKRWNAELNPFDSLRDAGRWIGVLERVLTITLVYCGQFEAIGFLITAKSILRISDNPGRQNNEPGLVKPFSARKHTEYVLIGTFLSFSIALFTGLAVNHFLAV